jgi:hypothetical protein
MRIPKTWIPPLAKKIVDNLISKELIKPAIPIKRLLSETEEILLDELTIEDRLNEEVRELLKSYASTIEQGRMDYRKLFELTKHKLVKERNLIL